MCRQTQRTWLGGTYPSTSVEGGLADANFKAIAKAYEIPVYEKLTEMLDDEGMGFFQFECGLDEQIVPQVRFGKALEDADPLLPREELAEIMR